VEINKNKSRPVVVKRVPERLNRIQARKLLSEVRPFLESDRPQVVFDFSNVRQMDTAGVEMLLYCVSQAMKRDGDVKLASVSPRRRRFWSSPAPGGCSKLMRTRPTRCAASVVFCPTPCGFPLRPPPATGTPRRMLHDCSLA